MAQDSKIEWTDATFNPWRGCQKVSPGCVHCYAETLSKRNPAVLGVWGSEGTRVVASESYWRQPLRWDREAKAAGERRRVFCASLADVFEDRPELVAPRIRLFHLISETPHLDWLLLTKRPENVRRFCGGDGVPRSWAETMPPNVWLGASVESAAYLWRIDALKGNAASVLFLSIEPLLGPLPTLGEYLDGIDWVIVGGESGSGARPFDLAWVRSIVAHCRQAGVACFVKQLGANVVARNDEVADWFGDCGHLDLSPTERFQGAIGRVRGFRDPKGGDPAEWPEDLRVREMPTAFAPKS